MNRRRSLVVGKVKDRNLSDCQPSVKSRALLGSEGAFYDAAKSFFRLFTMSAMESLLEIIAMRSANAGL